jgi:hypothetical protein
MEPKKTISSYIKYRIETLKEGYIFTYLEFDNASKNKEAIIKCLSRMADAGKLYRFSKGKYYKPIKGDHKVIGPDVNEIIKDLLEKNGEPIGYVTGINVFNKPANNTPIHNTILIGRNTFKPPLYRSMYTIEFVLQRNVITKDNIEILQVLDCLKMINKIPDTNRDNVISIIGKIIRKYNKHQIVLLIQCSLKYNSATRALLGMILEIEKVKKGVDSIIESLNPASTYNLELNKIDRLLKNKWNIK